MYINISSLYRDWNGSDIPIILHICGKGIFLFVIGELIQDEYVTLAYMYIMFSTNFD